MRQRWPLWVSLSLENNCYQPAPMCQTYCAWFFGWFSFRQNGQLTSAKSLAVRYHGSCSLYRLHAVLLLCWLGSFAENLIGRTRCFAVANYFLDCCADFFAKDFTFCLIKSFLASLLLEKSFLDRRPQVFGLLEEVPTLGMKLRRIAEAAASADAYLHRFEAVDYEPWEALEQKSAIYRWKDTGEHQENFRLIRNRNYNQKSFFLAVVQLSSRFFSKMVSLGKLYFRAKRFRFGRLMISYFSP